ncbi:hypothetical protein [Pedobacter sp. P26]|uniref:hypothetical protein n=1 Tax=Pedobacter sp. P26 TaxID=3423956 RepID=UPI003D6687BC
MMRIYNTSSGIIINHNNQYFLTEEKSWDRFVNRSNLFKVISSELQQLQPNDDLQALTNSAILTPIGNQEVWASGVTYFRSREARIEESKEAKRWGFLCQGIRCRPAGTFF